MKKKIFAVLLASLMVVSMSMTAFAAPSSTAGGALDDIDEIEDILDDEDEDDDDDDDEDAIAEAVAEALEELLAGGEDIVVTEAVVEAAFEAAGAAKTASGEEIKVEKASVEAVKTIVEAIKELPVPAAVASAGKVQMLSVAEYKVENFTPGEDVALQVEGVKAGDNIMVIHIASTGIEYIQPSAVKNGEVVFAINSFSPIAMVKLPAGVTVAQYARAAKTQDVSYILMLAAVAALAGAVAFKKKAN